MFSYRFRTWVTLELGFEFLLKYEKHKKHKKSVSVLVEMYSSLRVVWDLLDVLFI